VDQSGARQSSLVVENLTKTYAEAKSPAISNLTFSMEPGEIFGLLGPNGAGKTTAISILSAVLGADEGRVVICGVDLFKKPRQAKRCFGLIPQDIALYGRMSARENLAYFGRLQGLGGKHLRQRIDESLEMVGLAGKSDQPVKTFSGGMKRRCNLAVGMLHQPRLLFLDEPTVGIDAQSRNLILEKLSLLREQGVSMIYTTHYMEEAESLCTRVGILDLGRMIVQGAPRDLIMAHPGCGTLGELFLELTGKHLRD